MKSGHTVNKLNGVATDVRRLETGRATQTGALAGRERADQEALGKEQEIARNEIAQMQRVLGKLRTEAETRLQAVNLELPANRLSHTQWTLDSFTLVTAPVRLRRRHEKP